MIPRSSEAQQRPSTESFPPVTHVTNGTDAPRALVRILPLRGYVAAGYAAERCAAMAHLTGGGFTMRSSVLLFGAAMALGLAACSNDAEPDETVLPGDSPSYQTEPATATPAPAPMTTDDSLLMRDTLMQRDSVPAPIDPLQPPPPAPPQS